MFDDSPGFTFLNTYLHWSWFTFIETQFSYLPSPYRSHCIDYRSVNRAPRNALIERCHHLGFYNQSSNNCRYNQKCISPFSHVTQADYQHLINHNMSSDVHFDSSGFESSGIRAMCSSLYPAPDCGHKQYQIVRKAENRLTRSSLKSDRTDPVHRVSIRLPLGLAMRSVETPRMELMDLLSILAGLISLWSGMTFLTVFEKCLQVDGDVVKTTFRKRRRTKRRRRDYKTMSSLIANAISLIGCFVHVFYLIQVYIDNPFKSECIMTKDATFELPSFLICTDSSNNPLKGLFFRYPNMTRGYRWLNHLPPTLGLAHTCYEIMLQTNWTTKWIYNRDEVRNTHFMRFGFYRSLIDWSNGLNITLYRNPLEISMQMGSDAQMTVREPLPDANVHIDYITYYRTLVGDHPQSSCLNSDKRFSLMEKCIDAKWVRRYDRLQNEQLFIAVRQCNRLIKPHCQQLQYKLQYRYTTHWNQNNVLFKLILLSPQQYDYKTIQSLRSSVSEFVANVGGTVGLWIGLSLYDLKMLASLVHNVCQKRMCVRRNQP